MGSTRIQFLSSLKPFTLVLFTIAFLGTQGQNILSDSINNDNRGFHIMGNGPNMTLVINDGISDDICYFQDNGWKMEKIEPHSYLDMNISSYSHNHSEIDYMIYLNKNGDITKKIPIRANNRLYNDDEFELSFTDNIDSTNKDNYTLYPEDKTRPREGYVGSYHFIYQPQHNLLTWKMISKNRFIRIRSKSVLRKKKGEHSKFIEDVFLDYFEIQNDTLISTKVIKQELSTFSLYKDGAVIYNSENDNLIKDLTLTICSDKVTFLELKEWKITDSIINKPFSPLFISHIDKDKIILIGNRETKNKILKERYVSYDKKDIEKYYQNFAYTNSREWLILTIYINDKKIKIDTIPFDDNLIYSINKWKTNIKHTFPYAHNQMLFGRSIRGDINENFDHFRIGYSLFDHYNTKAAIASECLIKLSSQEKMRISLPSSYSRPLRIGFLANDWHLSDVLIPSTDDSIFISRLITSKPLIDYGKDISYNGWYKGNTNFETCLLPYKIKGKYERYPWNDLYLKKDSVFKMKILKMSSLLYDLVPQNNAPRLNNGADVFSDGFDRIIIEGNNIQTAILPNLNHIESLESTYTKSGDIIIQYLAIVHDDYIFGMKTKEQKENWNSIGRLKKLNQDFYILEGEEIPFLTFNKPFGIKNIYYYPNPKEKRSQAIYLTDSIYCLKIDKNKYLAKFEYDGQEHNFTTHVFCENFDKKYEKKNEILNFSLLGVEGFLGVYCHNTKELILNSGELFSNINSLSLAKDQTVKRYLELRYFNTVTVE